MKGLQGPKCPWLGPLVTLHVKPIRRKDEAKCPTVNQRLGEALREAHGKEDGFDTGLVRYLNGRVGVNLEKWRLAMRYLVLHGDLSEEGYQDFDERFNQAAAGEPIRPKSIRDHFLPIETRLAVRLERGLRVDKAVIRGFSEACGLISAWMLRSRRFPLEELSIGVTELVAMSNQWGSVAETVLDDEPFDLVEDFASFGAKFLEQQEVTRHRLSFLWRLATWVKSLKARELLRPIFQQLYLDGYENFVGELEGEK